MVNLLLFLLLIASKEERIEYALHDFGWKLWDGFVALWRKPFPAPWKWGEYRRRDREAKGLCGQCGYDLRASPERCPECAPSISFT